ncbi:hypothetical protein [Celerinatantimonas sp. MCCC 1A17872]|uniref:hypothetical protein n=1 Tax=Celerinatantimonas sp. MCCC 1A17872 TaxID=3177514 RepID=UPI0038C0DE6D
MTKQEIYQRLLMRGLNFRQFALNHHYPPRQVLFAVDRWAGRNQLPHGRQTFHILVDLSKTIDAEIIPGLFKEV